MAFLFESRGILVILVCASVLLSGVSTNAAMDSRFELDPSLLAGSKAQAKPVRAVGKRKAARKSLAASANKSSRATVHTVESVPEHTFNLASPVIALSDQEAVSLLHDTWNKLIPGHGEQLKPLTLQSESFSLALDPAIYPSFAKMDGGRIILDQYDTIPSLVKSLIEAKDASVSIITEAPTATRQITSALLRSAGFYSVEEDFSMDFGVDPKLTVQSDFKVEKTADSLIKQDIVLINSGRSSLPPQIGEFLKKEGFSLHEPFAFLKPFVQRDSRVIHHISASSQPGLIDSILSSLSVVPQRDKQVDVFESDNNGISLTVKTDRYFERGGGRFVVSSFDSDPVNYTLLRILQTKGYNVVILEAKDDFRRISEKLITSMKIKGGYAQHVIVKDASAGYSLQMSGFKLDDASLPGGGVFLTDRTMDRIVKEVLSVNGFTLTSK